MTASAGADTQFVIDDLADVQRRLRTERRRTADESEALEAFRDRIDGLAVDTQTADRLRTGRGTLLDRQHRSGLGTVREAYETTVMRVPHYEAEYDDGYAESLSAEFGSAVAAALTEGTTFDATCKRILLTATAEAIDERHRFQERLAGERSAVETVESRLLPIVSELSEYRTDDLESRSFGTLDAYRRRLSVLETRCDDIAAERQRGIRNERLDRSVPVDDLQSYLYQSFNRTYPVLGAVVDVADGVRETRRAASRAIGYCL
jgi:hypothetical protein